MMLFAASAFLSAKEYPMPIIVTPEPVYCLQWGNKDKNFSYIEDKKIIIRDSDRFSIVKTINSPGNNFVSSKFISSFSADGDKVISNTEDGNMYFWNSPYTELNSVSGYDYAGKIFGIDFSSNGNYIAFGDRHGDIHLLRQHQVLKNEFSEKVIEGVKSPVYTVSFSENNKFVVTGTQSGMAYVWNTNTYKMVIGFNFYSRKNQKIVFDGDKIVYPVEKDTIGIRDFLNQSGGAVDADNLTVIKTSSNIVDYDLDPKGNFLVVVNENNGMDYIDVKNKSYIGSLPPLESGKITSVKLDLTGKKALVGDHKGEIFLINLEEFVEKDEKSAPTIRDGAMLPPKKNSADTGEGDKKETKKPAPKKTDENKSLIDADKYYKYRKGHSLDLRMNYLIQKQPYVHGYAAEIGYVFAEIPKIPSAYAGIRNGFQFSFPTSEYPYTYRVNNAKLQDPYLFSITTMFPVGFYIVPFKNTDFYFREEIDVGFSYESLWNGSSGSNAIITKGGFSFEMGDTFSFGWKDLLLNVTAKYNTAIGVEFLVGLGYNWKLTKRIYPEKQNAAPQNTKDAQPKQKK